MKYFDLKWSECSFVALAAMAGFATISTSCKSQSSLPTAHVGAMEANHPWMIFDPTLEHAPIVSPQGDKEDPDILYLVFVAIGPGEGNAVKINLRTKEISPYRFNVSKWQDVRNFTVRWELGYQWENTAAPAWIEFRGKREDRVVNHMFGDPVPTRPGTYKAELRSGYYYIMDKVKGLPIELLRVKIKNSDLDFGGLGTAYISPNGKWLVFVMANTPSRTFIFRRDGTALPTFQTDHEDQAIEEWKEWGEKMGAKP